MWLSLFQFLSAFLPYSDNLGQKAAGATFVIVAFNYDVTFTVLLQWFGSFLEKENTFSEIIQQNSLTGLHNTIT